MGRGHSHKSDLHCENASLKETILCNVNKSLIRIPDGNLETKKTHKNFLANSPEASFEKTSPTHDQAINIASAKHVRERFKD